MARAWRTPRFEIALPGAMACLGNPMPQYVAFLRGINLGNRRIKMGDLRQLFAAMKFTDVATFIASGNVVFSSPGSDRGAMQRQIEAHLQQSLGYAVDTFVRTRAEVAAVAAHRPFPPEALAAPFHGIYVGFLKERLSAGQARGLVACRTAVDEFRVEGREFYWLCRIASHESKVWSSPPVKALQLPSSSMRNVATIRKLAAQFPAGSP